MSRKSVSIILIFSLFIIGAISWDSVFAQDTNITSPVQVHKLIVNRGLASFNEKGQIIIDSSAIELGVSEALFNEYLVSIDKLNYAVEKEVMSFDAEFQLLVMTHEEVKKKLYRQAVQKPQNILSYDDFFCPMQIESGHPSVNVKLLVTANRNDLENIFEAALTAQTFGGGDAFWFAVGYWVGKVQPGGDWDYKVQPYYRPWYKKFECYFFTSGFEVKDSAYIGNYNYGFTGQLLFSKDMLLLGGDVVGLVTGRGPDGEEDKIPVRRGFDDARNYR
ncbi:MAG: hypothetical protein COA82_06315 [Alkaliphilus sp.]|nr:MAG: hypothetical protein COA82_06315 [Alkaliphilus sp.]